MSTTSQSMAISDFNLEKLNVKQLEQHISSSIAAGSNVAVFGRRGNGKTQISRQRIKNSGYREVYANLSVFDRTDLCGFPLLLGQKDDGKEHFVRYMLPTLFQPMIEGDAPVILLLDEVDKADPSLWAPLLEITQEKSINGRPLPNLVSCVMTGNLISEGGSRPSLPLLDRTEKYLLEANTQFWLEWAVASGEIHPSIYQWVSDHPTVLLGEGDDGDNYSDTSPRGCHLASKVLFFGEKNGWDISLLYQKVAGYLGRKNGLGFQIYYTNYKTLLPLIDRIFSDGSYEEDFKKLTPTEKLYASTIVCSRLASQLDAGTPEDPPKSIKQVGRFMQQISYENVLVSMRSQIKGPRILRYKLHENKHWENILNKVQQKTEKV